MTNRTRTIVLAAAFPLLACAANAADAAGTALLPPGATSSFKLSAAAAPYARMNTTALTGQPISSALLG